MFTFQSTAAWERGYSHSVSLVLQKPHWYGLLGSQSVSPRPELLVSLSVEEDSQQPSKDSSETWLLD